MITRLSAVIALALALVVAPAAATVNSSANKTIVAGNGAQTAFAFSFIGVAAQYISVIYTDASGNQTTLTQGSGTTQYQISLNAPVQGAIWGLGGTVTYNPNGSPIAAGTTLTIVRTLPLTQAITLQNQSSIQTLGKGSETAIDTTVMQDQQINEQTARALQMNIANSIPPAPLPPAAQVAGLGLCFDGTGNNVIGCSLAPSGVISSAMAPVVAASSIAAAQALLGIAPNVATLLGEFGVTPSAPLYGAQGSFWSDINDADGNMNARVHPFRDRLFVDDGALESGTWNGGAGGLANTRSGTAINNFTWNWAPREASLLAINSWGELAIVGMSVATQAGRSGDPNPAINVSPIGVSGFALNNLTTNPINTWGGYFETLRTATGVGTAFALEADTGNTGPIIDIDPYTAVSGSTGQTIGLWNACGGSSGTVVTYTNCSAALSFVNNGARWRKGIVFTVGGFDTSVGTSGGGVAMDLPTSSELRWFAGAGSPSMELWGGGGGLTVRTPLGGTHIGTFGTAPTITSCGTSPGVATGTDHDGFVTEGASTGQCVIVFATGFSATPKCLANLIAGGATAIAVAPSTVNAGSVTFVHAAESNAVLTWHCDGN